MVNTADRRKVPQDTATEVPKMLRNLRDANRGDELLVMRCNRMILMIKNLQKEEARPTDRNREARKNLRKSLADEMAWLAKWARDNARQP